jgi:hypothetical protein
MNIPVMNYLVMELLTLIYPLFLMKTKLIPIYIPIFIFLTHFIRFNKYYKYVNTDMYMNIKILSIICVALLLFSNNFYMLGIIIGMLMFYTYNLNEKMMNIKFKWINYPIDVCITIISGIIVSQNIKSPNIYLAPFLGDFIYHILEFATKLT